MRVDGRAADQLRPIRITLDYLRHAEGSVLIELGETRVICTVTVENRVPPHAKEQNQGWLTAEYAMLPRSVSTRVPRDSARGHVSGRSAEIQRLIGRALRSVVRLDKLGERTFIIDCDVIQGDGGTRTAAITGAFVALASAVRKLRAENQIGKDILTDFLAAVSVGIVEGEPVLDLCYLEDAAAEVDMNVVMTGSGKFVEIQGTAESKPFDLQQMEQLLALARVGVAQLIAKQKEVLGLDAVP
ncbi:MAG: ribonuclease PH [Candidatus Sumerlaeia bacterium]|nr:ribonuclease PH [Candidatus Sumerlaeia bacterium]